MTDNTRRRIRVLFVLVFIFLLNGPINAQALGGVFEKRFGFEGVSVAGAGDVNQDGFDDMIVGNPSADPGGKDGAGSACVYSGRDGTTLREFDGEAAGDNFGVVAGAGDVNQDGFPDVIVGAPRADPDGRDRAGSAFVFSGKDGTLLWRFDGAAENAQLGRSVAGAEDVNQDGFADVIVGTLLGGSDGAGSAHVYSGKDGSELWRFEDALAGALLALGTSVAGAGDVNQDGFADVVVGAPTSIPPGEPLPAGSALVYSGKDGTVLWRFDGTLGEFLGWSVAGAGDVNQDGFPDVIVGAPDFGQDLVRPGSAYIYSGRDGTTIWHLHGDPGVGHLGRWVAGAGDVNQDGFPDVIVGAPDSSPAGVLGGSAYVYSGKDGTTLWRFDGQERDALGWTVAGAGDVNQDGFPDVMVGKPTVVIPSVLSACVFVHEPAFRWYGSGLAGTGNITPRIGTGSEIPRIGNSSFKIQITEGIGGALCAISGSIAPAETSLLGVTLYGDFLTPGASGNWFSFATGTSGFPGIGTATLSIEIPNMPRLIGFTTYWQGFLLDSGSSSSVGVSHTRALAITLVR